MIILILVVPTFINAVQSAYTPTTIASASLPVRASFPDWLQALSWMNNNLPSTSVVFAWWDYGYWISVNTGLHTLADNGTGNQTQIQIIATGLMLNESMAVNLLHQFGVTHVAVFVSYNYEAGSSQGLCSSTSLSPPFCGYGDDSKWYWMVRIGNGTTINTALGPAKVTYKQVTTNPQTGASVYNRYIVIGGHTDNGTAITTTYQQTQIPASNTLLGLLMRNSFPNAPITHAQDSQDRGDPAGHGPYFMSRVFQSPNKYVLVYQVNYPQSPGVTAMLNPPYIAKGTATNITGTLSYPNGLPVSTTGIQVNLQYSSAGSNWNPIGNVTISSAGTFSYNNWKPPSTGSLTYMRAWWPGDRTLNLNLALSGNQTLIQY